MTEFSKNTVLDKEISQFQKDSAHWWDESGAFAGNALHRDHTAVVFDDAVAYGQTEPGTTTFGACREKGLEDPVQIGRGMPTPLSENWTRIADSSGMFLMVTWIWAST